MAEMKILITGSGRVRLRNGKLALALAGAYVPPPDPTPPPAGEITINAERQFRWIYQRAGTSKSIAVSGTSTAPVGTVIEARAVDELSGAGIQAWAQVGVVAADGTWSGTMTVPQGKWYRRQARIINSDTAVATETNSFGVGLWIACIGQSNMANFLTTFDRSPLGDPAAYEFNTGGAIRRVSNISRKNATTGEDIYPPNTLRTGGYVDNFTASGRVADGHVFLANLVAQGTGLPVAVINKAVIGSTIEAWMPDANPNTSTPWELFAADLTLVGQDCEIVLWLQGEYNINNTRADYQTKLDTLYANLKTLTGRTATNLKFGMISLGPATFGQAGNSDVKFGAMRETQADWARKTPGAFYAASAYDVYTGGDGIHMGGVAFSILGRRYAKSVLAQLGIGTTAAGPRIAGASISGSTITVQVEHTGGTSLRDGRGGLGTSLRGFQVFDGAGNPVAISSTAIPSATTVDLNLATTPTGPCTVSYAMANEPIRPGVVFDKATYNYIDPDDAYCLVDNSPIYKTAIDDPKGCPLQPCAAIPVTGS